MKTLVDYSCIYIAFKNVIFFFKANEIKVQRFSSLHKFSIKDSPLKIRIYERCLSKVKCSFVQIVIASQK